MNESVDHQKSLRALIRKWFGPFTFGKVHVLDVGRVAAGTRYVRIGASKSRETFSVVFFRHMDGTWNVFPPCNQVLAMGTSSRYLQ